MRYKYISIPKFIPEEEYHSAIQRMNSLLIRNPEVKSVYQVGGISTPGISDIDLYVVFHNGMDYKINPVLELKGTDKYLFTHNLFGTSENIARQMEQFTFFGNYNFIAGEKIDLNEIKLEENELLVVKPQIALEYLIKAYINISIGVVTRTIKARSLLLHSKALLYDLALLNISSGEMIDCVNEIILIRNNWFQKADSLKKLDKIIERYRQALVTTILDTIIKHGFYTPGVTKFNIGPRLTLQHSESFRFNKKGIILPSFLINISSKFIKLQSRLNEYRLLLPFTINDSPRIITQRINTIAEGIEYNEKYLPGFLCTAYPMNIFKKNPANENS